MEYLLYQRPFINPPHQWDNFAKDDHIFDTEEKALYYGGQNDVPLTDVDNEDF